MIKIIRYVNINKVDDHDNISIRMTKICDRAIGKSLSIVYKNCIDIAIFQNLWKEPNIVSVHEKRK